MRRKLFPVICGAIVILAAIGAVIIQISVFQKRREPPVLQLPADEEVAEMRASLLEFRGLRPAVPEFVVPKDRVAGILQWLRPAEAARYPTPFQPIDEMGMVVIRVQDGRELRLRFYWTGQSAVMFTPNDIDQYEGSVEGNGDFFDGGMRLRGLILKAAGLNR
jgi:hypothetical protein